MRKARGKRGRMHFAPRQQEILALLTQRASWTMGELASALGISAPAITKHIERLEGKGAVERVNDPSNHHCVLVNLIPVSKVGITRFTRRQREILALLFQGERWSMGELAAALGISVPSVTTHIDRLERQEFVQREFDASHRRLVTVSLTPAGRDKLRPF